MKRFGVVGTALVGVLAGLVVRAEDPAAAMLGRPAPSFRLQDVRTGKTHALEDFRGRFVVLHFGASW